MPTCATRPPGKHARHSSAVPELGQLRLAPEGLREPFQAVEPAFHASAAGKQRCNPHRLQMRHGKHRCRRWFTQLAVGKWGGAITVGLSHICGRRRAEVCKVPCSFRGRRLAGEIGSGRPHYPSLAYNDGVNEMIAVVETEEFLADVKGVLSENEHDALILYVALHPEAGDVIPETGGLRKLRWTAKGRGKRGGARVIYYFHDVHVPLFLMAIFAKNVQTDLSTRQRRALTRQLRGLKSDCREKKPK